MNNGEIATGLGVAGLLAMIMMKNPNAIKSLVDRKSLGKATRKESAIRAVKPFTHIHTNVSPPIGYNLAGQVAGYKTVAKHPIKSFKQVVMKGEPLWQDPTLRKHHWPNLLKVQTPKHRETYERMGAKWMYDNINARQPIYRPAFRLKTQKNLKEFDDIYIKNPDGTMSFNPKNPKGAAYLKTPKGAKYPDGKPVTPRGIHDIAKQKDKLRKLFPGDTSMLEGGGGYVPYHHIVGGFADDVMIQGKRHWEDVWNVSLNKSDKLREAELLRNVWKQAKTKRKLGVIPTANKEDLTELATLQGRKAWDYIMDPVTLRGKINPEDLL